MRNGPGVEERGILTSASYDQIVGGVPVAKVTVAGQPVDCVLDTGSQVSFVTESFYQAILQPQGHLLHSARNWLSIRAADGLEIPYFGYFETTVCVAGVTVEDRAILVRDAGHKLPAIFGMNVTSRNLLDVCGKGNCCRQLPIRTSGRLTSCVRTCQVNCIRTRSWRANGTNRHIRATHHRMWTASRYERCRVRPLVHGVSC